MKHFSYSLLTTVCCLAVAAVCALAQWLAGTGYTAKQRSNNFFDTLYSCIRKSVNAIFTQLSLPYRSVYWRAFAGGITCLFMLPSPAQGQIDPPCTPLIISFELLNVNNGCNGDNTVSVTALTADGNLAYIISDADGNVVLTTNEDEFIPPITLNGTYQIQAVAYCDGTVLGTTISDLSTQLNDGQIDISEPEFVFLPMPLTVETEPVAVLGGWGIIAVISGGMNGFNSPGFYSTSCFAELISPMFMIPVTLLFPGPFAPGAIFNCEIGADCGYNVSETLPNYDPTLQSCIPNAEGLIALQDNIVCSNDTPAFEVGANDDNIVTYLLANPDGDILLTSQSGIFDLEGIAAGTYNIWATAHCPGTTLNTGTIEDIAEMAIDSLVDIEEPLPLTIVPPINIEQSLIVINGMATWQFIVSGGAPSGLGYSVSPFDAFESTTTTEPFIYWLNLNACDLYAADPNGGADIVFESGTCSASKFVEFADIASLCEGNAPVATFQTTPAATNNNADTLFICSGQSVYFDNQSSNANAFVWQFGDGNSSTESNPTYTYNQAGTYTAQMVAYNNIQADCAPILLDDYVSVDINEPDTWTIAPLLNDINPCGGNLILTNISGVGLTDSSMVGSLIILNDIFLDGGATVNITYTACNEMGLCSTAIIQVAVVCMYLELEPVCVPGEGWQVLATVSGGDVETHSVGLYHSSCPIELVSGGIAGGLVTSPAEYWILDPFAPGSTVDCTFGDNSFCEVSGSIVLPNDACGLSSGLSDSATLGAKPHLPNTNHTTPNQTPLPKSGGSSSDCDNPDHVFHTTIFFPITATLPLSAPGATSIISNPSYGAVTTSVGASGGQLSLIITYTPLGMGNLSAVDCFAVQTIDGIFWYQIIIGNPFSSCDNADFIYYTAPDTPIGIFTYGISFQPQNGTIIFTDNGYEYVPDPGFVGTDCVGLQFDGVDGVALIVVAELPSCDSPSLTANTPVNTAVSGMASLPYAYYGFFDPPLHGTVSIDTPPLPASWTYTPDPDFEGIDCFGFQFNDGQTFYIQVQVIDPELSAAADTATLIIVVSPDEAPDIVCISTVCAGDTAAYHTNAVCSSYEWAVTRGAILSGQGSGNISIVWGAGSVGTLSLTVDCGDGTCQTPVVVSVPIVGAIATINGDADVCPNETATYNAPYFGGTTYTWSINPTTAGAIVNGQGSPFVVVQWNNQSAVLSVNYQNDILGCGGTAQLPVTIRAIYQILNAPPVCIDNTSTLQTDLPGAFVWTVTNGTILSGQNTDQITVQWNTTGTAQITALSVVPDMYCNTSANATQTVSPRPNAIETLTGDTLVCPNQTATYTAGPLQSGTQFVWTSANGTILAGQNTATVLVQWADDDLPGDISVIQQSVFLANCSSEPMSLIVQKLLGDDLQISGSPSVCVYTQATYTAAPLLPDADYTWAIDPFSAGSIISGQGSPTIKVQWHEAATATLSVGICSVTSSLAVSVNTLSQPLIVQADTLCLGSTATLSLTDTTDVSAVYTAYTWRDVNALIISSDATATVSQAGVYSVEVINAQGCTATALRQVSGYTPPVDSIIGNGHGICTQTPFNKDLLAIDGTNYAFAWLLNDSPIADNNTPFYTHIGTSEVTTFNYSVLVTDTTSTCTTLSDSYFIQQYFCPPDTIIDPPPSGSTTINVLCPYTPTHQVLFDVQSNCQNITLTQLSVGDFSGFIVSWGDASSEPFNGSTISHSYSGLSNYHIRVIGTFIHPVTEEVCATYASKQHIVPLAARFDVVPACVGAAWIFQDRSYYWPTTYLTTWTWDFGDGSSPVFGTQTEQHTYANPGNYAVTLSISNDTCTVSYTTTVQVADLPTANFSTEGATCANHIVSFLPANPDYIRYAWGFGDGAVNNALSPTYAYDAAGTYTATLQTTDERGCQSLPVEADIDISPESSGNISVSDTVICVNENAILTAPSGGVAYLWSSGETDAVISVTAGGSYSVSVTLPDACSYVTPKVRIEQVPLPNAAINLADNHPYICADSSKTLFAVSDPNYSYTWSSGESGANISVMSSGTWYLTVTDAQGGCTAMDSIATLLQSPIPAPIINLSEEEVCEGDVATLTAMVNGTSGNGYAITWSTGASGDSINTYSSGAYTAVATDPYGCSSPLSDEAILSVLDAPDITAFPVGCYTLCLGDTISVPVGSATYYEWFFDDMPMSLPPLAAQNAIVPQQSGDYYVVMESCRRDTSDVLHLEVINCSVPDDTSTLAVTLRYFTGEVATHTNLLRWASSSETDNAYYTLQRSPDATHFDNLAIVAATGNNSNTEQSYAYSDELPLPFAYYRLLQTDYSGKTTDISTISLQRPQIQDAGLALYAAYPIPIQDRLTLQFYAPSNQTIHIFLYDILGRCVVQQSSNAIGGIQQTNLDTQFLPEGMYVVQLSNGSESIVHKVVK